MMVVSVLYYARYRTELDGAEAERREITEKRLTSIDRRLLRDA
jgi:hypothetical protein